MSFDEIVEEVLKLTGEERDALRSYLDQYEAMENDAGLSWIKAARFPVIKTLESFRWDWPKKINQLQIQDLFRLRFIDEKANAIFLGLCGLGKTHLATALGYAACQHGYSVLFANAIDAINTLSAAQAQGALKTQLKRYLSPALLVLDEVGYLPIDQRGADLLFQVISQRYERGSIVITSNKAFKQWPTIFNGDSTITSAVLDRLLHHAETIIIEGSSYRNTPGYRAHIVCEDSEAAGVTFLGTESLEDLGGSVRMSFQPALNDDFVGIELTFAQPLATALDVILCASPFSHRLFIEVQLTGDLGKIQAALLMQEPNLRVKLVGDHGCWGPPDSNI